MVDYFLEYWGQTGYQMGDLYVRGEFWFVILVCIEFLFFGVVSLVFQCCKLPPFSSVAECL